MIGAYGGAAKVWRSAIVADAGRALVQSGGAHNVVHFSTLITHKSLADLDAWLSIDPQNPRKLCFSRVSYGRDQQKLYSASRDDQILKIAHRSKRCSWRSVSSSVVSQQ